MIVTPALPMAPSAPPIEACDRSIACHRAQAQWYESLIAVLVSRLGGDVTVTPAEQVPRLEEAGLTFEQTQDGLRIRRRR